MANIALSSSFIFTCNIIFFCRKGTGFILFDQILFQIMTAHSIIFPSQ